MVLAWYILSTEATLPHATQIVLVCICDCVCVCVCVSAYIICMFVIIVCYLIREAMNIPLSRVTLSECQLEAACVWYCCQAALHPYIQHMLYPHFY